MTWYLSPSGWPTHADDGSLFAGSLAAHGWLVIDESQVAAAVAAYNAGEPAPPAVDFFDTEVASLVPGPSATATALRAAFARTPSDVGARLGVFDPAHSIYYPANFTPLRRIRSKLGAVAGGKANTLAKIVQVGHSAVSSYGSTVGVNDSSVALRKLLAARYPVGSGVAQAYNNNPTTPWDSRWAWTGSWSYFGSAPGGGDLQSFRTSTAVGNTGTFTSDVPGTILDIFTFGNGGGFTYSIDGGSAVTFTPNGASAVQQITVTGLANTVHTVVITTNSTAVTGIIGAGVRPSIAVEVDALGFFGAFAADFLTTDFYETGPTAVAFAADLYLIHLDGNEALMGQPPATLATNLAAVVALFKATGADVALITSANPNIDATLWGTYRTKVYDVADSADVPVVDLTDRLGTHATALANGMHDADNVHLSPAGYADTALAVSGLLL